ncbi:hypothetical protein QFC24_003002 [Naganishia onofrii]|uniref:Uncharacterized protein n=1 Tax=Naganishia onofrii TaxID=1851511 RepID=A0ACC2XMM4_9TREE|nr:hypothetical protein QFC24_003002 [Naganishia onofrii]
MSSTGSTPKNDDDASLSPDDKDLDSEKQGTVATPKLPQDLPVSWSSMSRKFGTAQMMVVATVARGMTHFGEHNNAKIEHAKTCVQEVIEYRGVAFAPGSFGPHAPSPTFEYRQKIWQGVLDEIAKFPKLEKFVEEGVPASREAFHEALMKIVDGQISVLLVPLAELFDEVETDIAKKHLKDIWMKPKESEVGVAVLNFAVILYQKLVAGQQAQSAGDAEGNPSDSESEANASPASQNTDATAGSQGTGSANSAADSARSNSVGSLKETNEDPQRSSFIKTARSVAGSDASVKGAEEEKDVGELSRFTDKDGDSKASVLSKNTTSSSAA